MVYGLRPQSTRLTGFFMQFLGRGKSFTAAPRLWPKMHCANRLPTAPKLNIKANQLNSVKIYLAPGYPVRWRKPAATARMPPAGALLPPACSRMQSCTKLNFPIVAGLNTNG